MTAMLAVALATARQVDPARRLAGMSLLLRMLLTLQRQGASRILLVLPDGCADLAACVQSDPRLRTPLTAVAVDELAEQLNERFALARHHLVVDPAAEPVMVEPDVDFNQLSGLDVDHPSWVVDVSDQVGERRAVRALFEACRKPVDGIVSRHLNRHVSLSLSRLLVNTPVTPNMMTIVTFGVSLVACWLVLDASYATTAAAGVLMQLNSILDGCDGELARVRHQGSKLGQWLDTVGDDLSNVLFWTALGFGALQLQSHGDLLAIAAWVTAAGNGVAAAANYVLLSMKGSGDFYALRQGESTGGAGFVGRVVALFNAILRQDFFLLFVMVMALAGLLHQAAPLLAVAAIITAGVSTVRLVRVLAQPNKK